MATHSRILVWEIPWTEEPGGVASPWGHKESDTTERLNSNNNVTRNLSQTYVSTSNALLRQLGLWCSNKQL